MRPGRAVDCAPHLGVGEFSHCIFLAEWSDHQRSYWSINPGTFRSKINAWSQGNRHPVTKISQEARNFSLVNDVPMHLSRRTLSEPAQAVMMLQATKPAEGCIELTICLASIPPNKRLGGVWCRERLGIRVVLGEIALDGAVQVDDRMEAARMNNHGRDQSSIGPKSNG